MICTVPCHFCHGLNFIKNYVHIFSISKGRKAAEVANLKFSFSPRQADLVVDWPGNCLFYQNLKIGNFWGRKALCDRGKCHYFTKFFQAQKNLKRCNKILLTFRDYVVC